MSRLDRAAIGYHYVRSDFYRLWLDERVVYSCGYPQYAKTLQHWSRRLEARRAPAARSVSDRTLRIWRAYLAGSAYGFAQGWMSIYQLLGSR